MSILKQLVFFLWGGIKKILKFLFVPYRNLSLRYAQYLLWEFSIGIILAIIFSQYRESILQYTMFIFVHLFFFSALYWWLTFMYFRRNKKGSKLERDIKYEGFLHEYSDINEVIEAVHNLKIKIIDWARNDQNTENDENVKNDEKKVLKKVKLLRIYYKSSSAKKVLEYLTNTSIGIILGLISGLILKPEVMDFIKNIFKDSFNHISDSIINYVNGGTLLITGLMIVSKILVQNHRVTRMYQLYDEVLDSVVEDLEEELKTEDNLGA
ncbi:hypothetical protein [Bacillus]|nr:hypothetical protein [Bacillus]ADV93377.1 hypothetical protein BSn5_03735 [Bacillus subtilis BSn5]KAA0937738.1 hypothetical protein FQ086_09340 [Bacillus sp. ANT_WA51]MBT2169728.1 hypothetical protein [Bacillus subtilis]MCZ8477700.1 hypothetical protein [Bacillus subtilis]MDD9766064.1 hypothetical protein [Bacillus subtilis]